jgi:heme A synthase
MIGVGKREDLIKDFERTEKQGPWTYIVVGLIMTIGFIRRGNLTMIGSLLAMQITLGILNVMLSIPMVIATFHNTVALLLTLNE